MQQCGDIDHAAVWDAIPEDMRAIIVMVSTDRPVSLAGRIKWEDFSRLERDLIGTTVRAFGRVCSGDACRLGLPAGVVL